jgi:hypothetical protein
MGGDEDGKEEEEEEEEGAIEGKTRTGPYGSPSGRKGKMPSPRKTPSPRRGIGLSFIDAFLS